MSNRFHHLVHHYVESLEDVIRVALYQLNQPLSPERMYIDKFGDVNFDWMIDTVYEIYTRELDVMDGVDYDPSNLAYGHHVRTRLNA